MVAAEWDNTNQQDITSVQLSACVSSIYTHIDLQGNSFVVLEKRDIEHIALSRVLESI